MTALRTAKHFAHLTAAPWANGKGSTTELVGFDESALHTPGAPRWRLSVASLTEPGAFSRLPSVWRTFFLVEGEATLDVDGIPHRIGAGQQLQFDGGAAVELLELSKPTHAINLMVMSGTDHPHLGLTSTAEPVEPVVAAVALAPAPQRSRFDLLLPDDAPENSSSHVAPAAYIVWPGRYT